MIRTASATPPGRTTTHLSYPPCRRGAVQAEQTAKLSDVQIERYSRQIVLPEIGARGQQRLLATALAVVAARGEAPALPYLVAAGAGRLGLMNLTTSACARAAIAVTNPDTTVVSLTNCSDAPALQDSLRPYQAVIDGGESGELRAALNRACVALGIPLVAGTAAGDEVCITTFAGHLRGVPCYACIVSPLPHEAADSPLREVAADLLGTLQAAEALKCVLEVGEPLYGRLLSFDVARGAVHSTPLPKNAACAVCGGGARA
ncbi:MAG: ThiF family adenylyltransferase [Deltaproteobacteria bacterium]|nr:ThiF family adenylyltransferase [Deltaproteobacteria bacterium]